MGKGKNVNVSQSLHESGSLHGVEPKRQAVNSTVFDEGGQRQMLTKTEVSDAELLALSSKLGIMKMMATAVGEELTTQNKSLDGMISSVEQADMKISNLTSRTKRLM
jgi:hypothetical protein